MREQDQFLQEILERAEANGFSDRGSDSLTLLDALDTTLERVEELAARVTRRPRKSDS